MPKIVRRLGTSPRERGSDRNYTCPDILQLENGDIAAIGRKADPEISEQLPALGASVGPGEELVVIPGEVYRSSVEDYLEGLASAEVLALLWPGLKQTAAGLLREWAESIRRLIAVWMARLQAAPLFA